MFACIHAPGNLPLLVECAGHFSPLIEETSPDTVVFDVRGLDRLHGDAARIADAIRRRVGLAEASIAIAANPDAAVHAARGFGGVTVFARLDPLPLHLLGGSPDFARNMDAWGIRTFREFAALPPLGIAARLGDEGAYLQRLATGTVRRQLRLRVDPMVFRERRELDDTIDLMEPLLLLISQMLGELCERLRYHGRMTTQLRLRLKLERAADYTLVLNLPVATLNARVMLKLLQLEMNEQPPAAPVEQVFVELEPADPRSVQHGLFLPAAPEPEKLEITLARIRVLVGAENVGAPELLDTHRTDAVWMTALAQSKGAYPPLRPAFALRRFRPPTPAQVWCADRGKPLRISSPVGSGAVVACAGPWASSGDWWTSSSWSRQEWDVEVQAMGVARISQDVARRRWFIEGSYD